MRHLGVVLVIADEDSVAGIDAEAIEHRLQVARIGLADAVQAIAADDNREKMAEAEVVEEGDGRVLGLVGADAEDMAVVDQAGQAFGEPRKGPAVIGFVAFVE